jgi:large subunit ribosomal protein L6
MKKVIDSKKKVWKEFEESIDLGESITAKYEDSILSINGPKGEVSKKLKYPRVKVEVKGNKIVLSSKHFGQREKKIIFTYRAHIKNMLKGVQEGFVYKLTVVYAKFPMSVSANGEKFEVKNLLGEKVPRVYKIPNDVKVEVKDKHITVSGIDKEKTGQVAASIEQLTRITHLDRRVIQDGIYIVEKPHRKYV